MSAAAIAFAQWRIASVGPAPIAIGLAFASAGAFVLWAAAVPRDRVWRAVVVLAILLGLAATFALMALARFAAMGYGWAAIAPAPGVTGYAIAYAAFVHPLLGSVVLGRALFMGGRRP